MSNLLIISFFVSSFFNSGTALVASCENFTVKVEVNNSIPSKQVRIVAENGKAPYKYIFYHSKGTLISKEWTKNEVNGLKEGQYYCTIIDSNNCRKSIEFEIF